VKMKKMLEKKTVENYGWASCDGCYRNWKMMADTLVRYRKEIEGLTHSFCIDSFTVL